METLHDLILKELGDIYDAEKQLVRALPKMAKAAKAPQLRLAMEHHLEETKTQVSRVEQAFRSLNQEPQSHPCDAMKGLLKEATETLEEDAPDSVKDAALIAAAQKIEHYEIASYGCLCTWLKELNELEAFNLLKRSINEEEITDKKLTSLAVTMVNDLAAETDKHWAIFGHGEPRSKRRRTVAIKPSRSKKLSRTTRVGSRGSKKRVVPSTKTKAGKRRRAVSRASA